MDAHKKVMRLCYQNEGRVCHKKREDVPIVKRREEESMQVYLRTIEKRVHQALKVISNSTSVFHKEEEWKEVYSIGL